MGFSNTFPAGSWIYRTITGRVARRVYLVLAVLLLIAGTAPRIRSMLMARKIHAVLSGMEKIQIDQTTEEQLLKTVPYLTPSPDFKRGTTIGHGYSVVISTEGDWKWLRRLPRWLETSIALVSFEMPDWMGYRYMRFSAWISLFNGKVSSLRYGIAPRLGFPREAFDLVSVRSVHGFWASRGFPFSITSVDDERPQFRVAESSPGSLEVIYTFDAPPELTSHAFHVELGCFWSLLGCHSAREMVPEVSHDREQIDSAAASRVAGVDPCPPSMLAGRVHYLLDLNVLLLETGDSIKGSTHRETHAGQEFSTNYRLREVIHGSATSRYSNSGDWIPEIPWPIDPRKQIRNPVPRPKPGDQILFFGGEFFTSCQLVPATMSVLTAVRAAAPSPKRPEDEMVWGLQ